MVKVTVMELPAIRLAWVCLIMMYSWPSTELLARRREERSLLTLNYALPVPVKPTAMVMLVVGMQLTALMRIGKEDPPIGMV